VKTSVLINNYNHAPFLRACIGSVLDQTQPADEVIFYDDGSSDESVAIARSFGSRVSVIAGRRFDRPARINQGHGIHEAFIRSTGDILFLLDSDDVFFPQKVARYHDAFVERPDTILVQAPMAWIDVEGRKRPRLPEPFKHTANPFDLAYKLNDPDLFYPTSALAFSRDFLTRALPIDWSDNVPLWADTRLCLAALLSGPIVTLPDELGGWRQHSASDCARAALVRTYQLRQTLRRTRVFNRLCAAAGEPTISFWQNRRFYLQLLRLVAPRFVYRFYEKHFSAHAPAKTAAAL
jgi:glycosyltransferase involved in cell wall biosynthesis